MRSELESGEIVLANLTFQTAKKKIIFCKEIVLSQSYDEKLKAKYLIDSRNDKMDLLTRCNIKEDVELIKVEVIKSLGFKIPKFEEDIKKPKKKK